jgi:hypothetical protein
MRLPNLLCGCLLLLPLAALANPEPADISEVKDKLVVLRDAKGHHLAVVPFGDFSDHLYYGDGKTMYLQRIYAGGSNGAESFNRSLWDPRVRAEVRFSEGKYWVECGTRKTTLTPLPKEDAAKVIDSAKFLKERWNRRAYALARDDRGTYYYVDKIRDDSSKGFRLYAGPRGKMKLLKMTNVVSDSAGDIFSTKDGELRLILNANDFRWIAGKKEAKLVPLPLQENAGLIYSELGVYDGEKLGTPCDEL